MKTNYTYAFAILISLTLIVACTKNESVANNPVTPPVVTPSSPTLKDSLTGSYFVKSVKWNVQGIIFIYDNTFGDACIRDNETKLGVDSIANFIDAGVSCGKDYQGSWHVSNDSIFFAGVHYNGTAALQTTWENLDQLYYSPNVTGGKIQSFDGTTLVFTGAPAFNTTDTITWVKK
jgi:hypothetical protein